MTTDDVGQEIDTAGHSDAAELVHDAAAMLSSIESLGGAISRLGKRLSNLARSSRRALRAIPLLSTRGRPVGPLPTDLDRERTRRLMIKKGVQL